MCRMSFGKVPVSETCSTLRYLKQEKCPCSIALTCPRFVSCIYSWWLPCLLALFVFLNDSFFYMCFFVCIIIFHFSAMDEETGEMPAALVVRKVGSVLSPKRIMDFVAELVRSDKTNFKCYNI